MASVAKAEGAIVVWRPDSLATAVSSSESAICHAIEVLAADGMAIPDVTLMVQCTSPFIEPEDVDLVVETLVGQCADSCFTAARTHSFLWRQADGGEAVAVNHDPARRLPRQQVDQEFVETGAVYGFRTDAFLRSRTRFVGRTVMAPVDAHRSLEIDEPSDLRMAQLLVASHTRGPRAARIPSSIRSMVFDFDGVMTDNRAFVFSNGDEGVLIDRGDGQGIKRLSEHSRLELLVLSTETSPVVRRRCEKLGLECISGIADKAPTLLGWLDERSIDAQDCLYVGNDLNDLTCMQLVGFSVAPANAMPEIKEVADLVLTHRGGDGAVRELIDLFFDADVEENRLMLDGTASVDR